MRKKRKAEMRALTDGDLLVALGGDSEVITSTEALAIPSLAGCVNFISSTIAMLPIELKSRDFTEIVEDDSRTQLLNGTTGDTLDAYQMKKAWIEDMLVEGEGYIYINRSRNRVKSLHYVSGSRVAVMENSDPIFKDYDISVDGIRYRDFDFLKLTRKTKNGVTGKGVVEENNEILSVAYNTLKFENSNVKSGGKKGFLQTDKKVEPSVIDGIKRAWKKFYGSNSDQVIVLNSGLTFKEAAMSSVELQLAENKKANSEEICAIFNLSPGIIDGTCNPEEYNNGIKTAILPIIKAIETSLNKDLLLESEQRSLYFTVDTKSLLKGDMLKRYTAYQTAIRNSFMTIDDVRAAEGLPPLGIDFINIGLDGVLYYPETKEAYTPNTKEHVTLKGGGVKDDESGDKS